MFPPSSWRSEITPLLFQGGTPPNADEPFGAVVDLEQAVCAYGLRSPGVPLYLHAPCDDSEVIPAWVESVAQFVLDMVNRGYKTLVHCSAGLNRSGLIVARVLVKLGYKPEVAIQAMRLARSPHVLCNQTFENYVLASA